MDVMFGTELPHMGLMPHATSAFVDPGLDYTLGYSQVQNVMGPQNVQECFTSIRPNAPLPGRIL